MRGLARRWWLVAVLLGAALVLLASALTTTRPGAGISPTPGQIVTLTAADPVEWTFETERPRLSQLRVWVAPPVPPDARLTLALSDVTLPALTMARAEAPLGAAGPDGAVDLRFEPLRAGASPHVPTTTLIVRLRLEGASGDRVALLGVDGAQVAFTPAYEARPFDAVWPLSALAEGRPGILGWPPFYALLAYAFLVVLLCSLLLAARAGPPQR